jgi:RecG-like helicase
MPRGFKPEISPGKIILTNGRPDEIFYPFNFGQVSQITFAQAEALQRMVQTATGAIDSAGIAGSINGEATAAGISMSLGAIIKRQKRTLINFQESFLIPFVTKAAHRYMQFDPEHYPVKDYKFNVVSSLGIIAREYEVSQLIQLLQTMSQESPLYSTLIQAVVENMNLSNREEMVALIQQAGQKSPEQQQAEQQAAQEAQALQKALQEAQIGVLNGQAEEFLARAKKYDAETKAVPVKLETEQIKTIGELDSDDERNFKQRVEIARLAIAEKGKGRR